MKILLSISLVLLMASAVTAGENGTLARIPKSGGQIPFSHTSSFFTGAVDASSAIVIDGLPFLDAGNTCGNTNDYDVDCPYVGAGSPDVLYSFMAGFSGYLRVDLCGSAFDTKLLVLDQNDGLVACNDDAYYDEVCGYNTSLIAGLEVTEGQIYYIVVDGYGGDCGDYILNISEVAEPEVCFLVCTGESEGEPSLTDGYQDSFNGGCNSSDLGYPFYDLIGGASGEFTLCGKSGWYDSSSRDTDWFIAIFGTNGIIELTLDAEQMTQGKVLSPLDCSNSVTIQEFVAGPCSPATMTINGSPGDLVWLWIAPLNFIPPAGFTGHEFNYTCSFSGLQDGAVATDETSWSMIKSMYR
ncbi:MAG: hypothetical protein KOO60_14495 [Gemmatimonadales bacterium]|nr:hypothetical protein [Gemmatimonadales bacterium]